jgi:hypothetical protein
VRLTKTKKARHCEVSRFNDAKRCWSLELPAAVTTAATATTTAVGVTVTTTAAIEITAAAVRVTATAAIAAAAAAGGAATTTVAATAAAVATASRTATAATTIATAAAAATAEAAATAAAWTTAATGVLLGFVNANGATIKLVAVHLRACSLGLCFLRESHEAEATRPTRFAVRDHFAVGDRSKLRESLTEAIIIRIPAQSTDKQLLRHTFSSDT